MKAVCTPIRRFVSVRGAVGGLFVTVLLLIALGATLRPGRTAAIPPAATTPTHLKIKLEKVQLQSAIDSPYTVTLLNAPVTLDVVTNTGSAGAKFGSGTAGQAAWNGIRATLGSTGTYTGIDPCTGDSVTDATINLPNATDQGVTLQYQVPHPVKGLPPGAVPAEQFTIGPNPINVQIVVPISNSVVCASQSPPLRTIAGASTALNNPFFLYLDSARDEIGVTNTPNDRVTVYQRTATGNVSATRALQGSHTGLQGPVGIALDDVNGEILVTNTGNNSITVYKVTADGDQAPLRTLQGGATGLASPGGLYVDPAQDEIGVANGGSNSITIYGRTDSGDQAPTRYIQGPDTGLSGACGIAHDSANHELFVTNSINDSVTVYNDSDGGGNNHDVTPKRVISGQRTGLSTPCGIYMDTANDEIAVANNSGNSITFYSRTASGNAFPLRTISGNATGLDGPSGIAIDGSHNELVVADNKNSSLTVHRLDDAKPFLAQVPLLRNSAWEQTLFANYVYSGTIDRVTGNPLAAPQFDGYRLVWKIVSGKLRQPADANSATLIPPANEVFGLADGSTVSNLSLGCNAFTPFTTLQLSTNCPPAALITTPFPPEGGFYRVAATLFAKIQNNRLPLHVTRLTLQEVPRLEPSVKLSTNDSILEIDWHYVYADNTAVDPPFPVITSQQLQINLANPYKVVSPCYTQVSGNAQTLVFSSDPLAPDARSLSDIKNNRCDIFLNDVAEMTFTVADAFGAQHVFNWRVN